MVICILAPTSAQLNELFDKRSSSSGDVPENSLVNGATDKDDRRDLDSPVVGQKVIHQAELESQLFKVRCGVNSSFDLKAQITASAPMDFFSLK